MRMFPRASRSLLEANGAVTTTHLDCVGVSASSPTGKASVETVTPSRQKVSRPRMNKTEADFAARLDAMKRRGEIANYAFEGCTLRLADDCRYTADFFVIISLDPLRIAFYETKGAHVWDDSKVKFRVAKEQNPWATFEMWQKKSGEWRQIL